MDKYHQQIIAILIKSDLDVAEVTKLDCIADMIFDRQQYPAISLLIKEKNWKAIESMDTSAAEYREYLSIYTFHDQVQQLYAVTIYDSDELWQDPEVLDIFPL